MADAILAQAIFFFYHLSYFYWMNVSVGRSPSPRLDREPYTIYRSGSDRIRIRIAGVQDFITIDER